MKRAAVAASALGLFLLATSVHAEDGLWAPPRPVGSTRVAGAVPR